MDPTAAEKPTVHIENWSVVDDVISPAYRDLAPGYRLTGLTLKYQDLPCGLIYSSAIIRVDRVALLAETAEAIYQLGQADPRYDSWLLSSSFKDAA
jgi:hypothetical protein